MSGWSHEFYYSQANGDPIRAAMTSFETLRDASTGRGGGVSTVAFLPQA